MKFKALVCLLALVPLAQAGGKIALTFDDAPRLSAAYQSAEQRTERLLKALKDAEVAQVTFFCTTRNLDRDKGRERLAAYANAGHLLANHTESHRHFRDMGTKGYIDDIAVAHHKLKEMKGFYPSFRYPFLNGGRNLEEQTQIREALVELGYEHGYVTVDNYDWYMEALFNRAVKDGVALDMAALKRAYIDILWQAIVFYDDLAKKTLGGSPRHVLLLHENDLASLFIGDLVAHIRAQGWEIITPIEAYQEPLFKNQPKKLCRQGRLACLARESGYRGMTGHVSEDEAWLEDYFKKHGVYKAN